MVHNPIFDAGPLYDSISSPQAGNINPHTQPKEKSTSKCTDESSPSGNYTKEHCQSFSVNLLPVSGKPRFMSVSVLDSNLMLAREKNGDERNELQLALPSWI